MKKTCPACGSNDVSSSTESTVVAIGRPPVVLCLDECRECKSAGDFLGRNDELIDAEVKIASSEYAIRAVARLTDSGYTAPYIDRVLRLPVGTTRRIGSGDVSPTEVALVRLVELAPWLLAQMDLSQSVVADDSTEDIPLMF